jgi:CRISPR-associated protein Csd1
MILQSLANYYQRLADDPNIDIPPFGWFRGRLDYVVTLNENGGFVSLVSQKRQEGKRLVGRKTLMPCIGKQALKHANSGKDANLLWDNSSFVFGLGNKGAVKLSSFISTIKDMVGDLNDEAVNAVIMFLEEGQRNPTQYSPILEHAEYGKEINEGRSCITFGMDEDVSPYVFARPCVEERISKLEFSEGAPRATCLITGKEDQPIELCHLVIKNIYGVQKDPNLISFNKESFNSFGKDQGTNSPVSQKGAFAYTTALNYLLASENQRMQVGDASTVFWAKNPCDLEQDFHSFLAPPKGEEAVSYDKIRGLLSAVKTGIPPQEADQPFYVLGLSPNASRIAVRFWYDGNVKEIKERVARHFQDLEMVRAPHDPEYLSLFQLLVSTATERKADNIPPNLGGDVARSVLTGTAYPRTLFANAIRRCKAEQRIDFARACIIKAFLVRNARIAESKQKEVSMALDTTYDNIGYVLGRLFAVLERIQEQAQGRGLNKTIRDTYFSAAASSPLVTFKRLQDLAIHHLAKIRNSGKSTVWLEKMLGEVENLIPPQGVPSILGLEDQGRFSVGYYHQRQEFFAKHETQEEGEEQ